MLKIIKEITISKKYTFISYYILNFSVITCLLIKLTNREFFSVFICLLSLFLFIIPFWIQKKFQITLPSIFEITILLFIFSTQILGEINNFYNLFSFWDTIHHFVGGFLCAAIGFSLINLLNNKHLKTFPIFLAIFAFCFSITIGTCWEIFEFAADKFFLTDMQKDVYIKNFSTVEFNKINSNKAISLNGIEKTTLYDANGNEIAFISNGYLDIGLYDTMEDLLINLLGAILFSILVYYYTLNKKNFTFLKSFIFLKNR